MKKKNITSIVIILAVILIAGAALFKSASAPTKETEKWDMSDATISNSYIWLTVDAALERAEQNGDIFRVISVNWEARPATMDYRPWRINASTVRGVVTEYYIEWESEWVEAPKQSAEELYIGLTLEQAQMLAVKNGTTLRAVSINWEPQATTRDYRPGRINAIIVEGLVSDFTVEGEDKN